MRSFLLAALGCAIAIGAQPALAQSSASNFTTDMRYDALRRVVGTIAPDPDGAGPLQHVAIRNTYDAAGRLIRVEAGKLDNWQAEVEVRGTGGDDKGERTMASWIKLGG